MSELSEPHPNGAKPAQDQAKEVSARVFKTRAFASFARRSRLGDADLCGAVERMRRGLVDADLGGGVVKQRIARPGAGRSGGFRTIVAFQFERHTFFVYGFAKNERDNIREDELNEFKRLAKSLLEAEENTLQAALDLGELIEVKCDEEDLQD